LALESASDREFESVVEQLQALEDSSKHQLQTKEDECAALRADARAAQQALAAAEAATHAAANDSSLEQLRELRRVAADRCVIALAELAELVCACSDHSASREEALRREVCELRAALEDSDRSAELSSCMEELGACRSRVLQVQSELESYRQMSARTTDSQAAEVRKLTA